MEALNTIPVEHTAAIVEGSTVYYSGKIQDTKVKWDNLPFDATHGIYQYILKAINGKWYRYTWMQF